METVLKYKRILNATVALAAIAYLGLGCAGSMMPPPGYFEAKGRAAGEGESEIVVSRYDPHPQRGAYKVSVFIDNQERMVLGAGETKTAIVPDGTHSIYAKLLSYKSRVLTVDAASNRTVFIEKWGFEGNELLHKYMEVPFDNLPDNEMPQNAAIPSSGQDLPKIAVYVTGNVGADEKEALGTRMLASLINSGRYMGIERSNSFLAEIEKEHIKQRSGAIDDNQISALGKQFGVKFVCIAAITPAFGDFQVSARIVDVETAQVIFIGESASPLKSMADLAQVSDQVVKNMFGEQAASARKPRSGQMPKLIANLDTLSPAAQYKYYKTGARFGTFALNFIPGLGSLVIMQDWKGAVTQLVLVGGGAALIITGVEPEGPNGLVWTGAAMVVGGLVYNNVRSITYIKKKPTNTASLENTGLNIAVLPDKDGNIKGYVAYRVEF